MYLGTIGSGIMEAMANFEATCKKALSQGQPADESLAKPVLDCIQILREAGKSMPDSTLVNLDCRIVYIPILPSLTGSSQALQSKGIHAFDLLSRFAIHTHYN